MTPQQQDAFFTVHRGLPREGPGVPADVAWALDHLGLAGGVDVLDAACGPGADLLTFADLLPQAHIEGIEKTPHFVREAQERIAAHAPRVFARLGDMAEISGPYDLIWCAGALYFLGVSEGLQGWHAALKPKGAVVFSEPVLLNTPPQAGVQAFWQDYPHITDLDGIVDRVKAAGFNVHGHRMIVGAPWAAYYSPLQARLDTLRAQSPDAALQEAIMEHQLEIERWRAAQADIAYALLITRPA